MNESNVKEVGKVEILIYEDGQLKISSSIEDQRALRDILKTAEESVIQSALVKVSKKSNIVTLSQPN